MERTEPHYCDHPPQATNRTGCPRWPDCARIGVTITPRPHRESDLPRDLAALAGMAVGAAIFIGVALLLIPLFT